MERPSYETTRSEHFDTSKTPTTTSDESKKKGSLLRRTQNLLEKRSHLNPLSSATKTIMNRIQINSDKKTADTAKGRTSSNLKSYPSRTIQSQSTNYNHSVSSPDAAAPLGHSSSLTHGTGIKSDVFDDKIGIKRVVIKDDQNRPISQTFSYRTPINEEASVAARLKQQICNQYSPHPINSKSPGPNQQRTTTNPLTQTTKSSAVVYFASDSMASPAIEEHDDKIRRVTVLTKPVSILKPIKKSNRSFEGSSPDKEDRVTMTQMSHNKKEATTEKKPLLISLLLNQTKESRLNKMMLKSNDKNTNNNNNNINNTRLTAPVRYNLNSTIVTTQKGQRDDNNENKNFNSTTLKRNIGKQQQGETFISTNNAQEVVDDFEDAEYLEANIKKCNEWLDKHVIPYFSLSNNSTSNELLSSSLEEYSD